jgi:hypothetical protein
MMTTHSRRVVLAVVAAGLLVVAGLLVRFPPQVYGFYPRCPVYQFTGLQCPGCGGTRAVAALLRGRLLEALRLNALVVGLMPLALGYGVAWARRKSGWPVVARGVWVGIGMATAVFGVVRNIG